MEDLTYSDDLEGNVRYLLDHTPNEFLVRCKEGGGPEDIIGSLCITYIKMMEIAKKTLKE